MNLRMIKIHIMCSSLNEDTDNNDDDFDNENDGNDVVDYDHYFISKIFQVPSPNTCLGSPSAAET